MKQLSLSEAKALYDAEAKNLQLRFESYYKYSFSFHAENARIYLFLGYGGLADEIYRYEVTTQPFSPPATFEKLRLLYRYIQIRDLLNDAEIIIEDE